MRRLRDATRHLHIRVEASLPLLDPGLTRARYVRVLESLYGFHAPLEPLLVAASAGHGPAIAIGDRAKVPLLAADLRALGQTPADLAALPRCCSLPALGDASHALGVLYVLEGATLGGRIIQRHLRASLGVDEATGAAFFAGYGDQTRAMWARFADHVDGAPGVDVEAAIGGAADAFTRLSHWLDASIGGS